MFTPTACIDPARLGMFRSVNRNRTKKNRRLVHLPVDGHTEEAYAKIAGSVSRGQTKEYKAACVCFTEFVAVFAGGVGKEILLELEA